MGLYDVIKDALQIAQKADNIELYKTLLEVQKVALDMQEDIIKLKEKNKELQENLEISKMIQRHPITIVTLENDEYETPYCSRCWDKDKHLVQVIINDNGTFDCPECDNKGLYSEEKRLDYNRKQAEAIASMNTSIHRQIKRNSGY